MLLTIEKQEQNNEDGFAAIVVALVLIIVLSLMTVGFAQLMRTNQQNALDKQLSDQAYYAAETGINDAAEAYVSGYTIKKTACDSSLSITNTNTANIDQNEPGWQYLKEPSINTTTDTGVTCILTDPTPQTLVYTVKPSQPTITEMEGCTTTISNAPTSECGTGNAASVGSINISWQDFNDSTPAPPPATSDPGCTSLNAQTASSGSWQYQNILRIELIPLSINPGISRSNLINSSYTAYLCPDNADSSTPTYNVVTDTGIESGDILSSHCSPASGNSPPDSCSVSLNVAGFNDTTYFLIMRGIYNNLIQPTITMTAGNGQPLDIGDAQLLVDSTGKSQNVLKRIVTRVPEKNQYNVPNAVMQGEVCKQLELVPSNTNSQLFSSYDASPCGVGGGMRSQL